MAYPATIACMTRPLIGITIDNVESDIASGRYESNVAYSRAVVAAGGLPLLLPQEVELAVQYVDLCDGLMLTGGTMPGPRASVFRRILKPDASNHDGRHLNWHSSTLWRRSRSVPFWVCAWECR